MQTPGLFPKKQGILLLLLFHIAPVWGEASKQPEPDKIKEAFIAAVNSSSTKEFYQLFNEQMRNRNTLSKVKQNFKQISDHLGNVKNLEFLSSSELTYSYRSIHRSGSLLVEFELDAAYNLAKMTIGPYTDETPALARNLSSLILPFQGEWYVFWGGTSISDNYHNAHANMKGAFDFWVMGENGKSHQAFAKRNEDFYAFGKEIIAPVSGHIVLVSDKVADNHWPAMNRKAGFGNLVMLETKHKEYLLFAHLKSKSIRVKKGDRVEQGQVLGLCGNSGNSTEPHLHFQLQNSPDLMSAKASHMYFESILINRQVKKDYSPRKGEKVRNR